MTIKILKQPNKQEKSPKLTTFGVFKGESLTAALATKLTKTLRLDNKNLKQLKNIWRRHPNIREIVNGEFYKRNIGKILEKNLNPLDKFVQSIAELEESEKLKELEKSDKI